MITRESVKAAVYDVLHDKGIAEAVADRLFGEGFRSIGLKITDETWETALNCAESVFEGHLRRNVVTRRAALDDALQHAVGIIVVRDMLKQESPQ